MNNNTQEIWMTVDEYDNYQVSCFGRIRNINTLKVMKQGLNTTGYYKIDLYKNKIRKTHTVHRLVAFAFCNNDNDYPLVDHIDRNSSNNNFTNLRWVTTSINGRNRTISINNTSGVQGVSFSIKDNSWVAKWTEILYIQKTKNFSVNKHGDEQAKQMAINHRLEMQNLHGYL